jgi:hypothetical protein
MKYHFCTLFDKNYLAYVLNLVDSLEEQVQDFSLYCFCMDQDSYLFMDNLKKKNLLVFSYHQLEDHYPELITAKNNRSPVEYYFTCSPSTCKYVLDFYPQIDMITYLDADLYFFSSPVSIFEELNQFSVGIIEQNFSWLGKMYEKYGKYNVGWVSFRNNANGLKCLEDWRQDCVRWCYDKLEDGKFGDQKYLDSWPDKYAGIKVINNIGANVAPWNVGRYRLHRDSSTNKITVNNYDLIFYHFAGFKQLDNENYITNVSRYFVSLRGILRNSIYLPYVKKLREYNNAIGQNILIKNRKEYLASDIMQIIKNSSRNIRKYIYKDNIKISSD